MSQRLRHLTARRVVVASAMGLLLVLLTLVLCVVVGPEDVDVLAALRDGAGSVGGDILFVARLPRAALAAIVGAALGAAGVAFQALLRNPLADPYILGVSGGAALGGTLALTLGLGVGLLGAALLPLFAFAGAVASVLLLYSLARIAGRVSVYTLLLTGVVFNAFAAAVIMFVKTLVSPQKAKELLFWLMGRLDNPEWGTLAMLGGYVLVGLVVLLWDTGAMNALALGDEGAMSLGVEVERVKRRILFASSLMVGAVVSLTGLIGFVGLIVPHAVRLVLGPDHRLLLPVAALAGAAFLMLSDLAARMLFQLFWTDSPVGVVTAAVGGPLFLWLLRRRATQGLW